MQTTVSLALWRCNSTRPLPLVGAIGVMFRVFGWRIIKDGKVTFSDFNHHYRWTPNYFTDAEAKKALDARFKAEEENWR